MKRGIFSFPYYIIRRKGQESGTVSFPLKNFLKDEGVVFRFYFFIVEGHHQAHVVLRLQVFHFLPCKMVGPEGKLGPSVFEEGAGFAIAVDASGEEHSHVRMSHDKFPAGGPGELGVGEEIDISFFYGFIIPALENGKQRA